MSKITIDIEARLASFESGLTAAQSKISGFENKLRGASRTAKTEFSEMATPLVAFGAALTAVSIGVEKFKTALNFGGQLDDLSELTGVSVEKLNELNYVAAGSGVAFETLATGMKKLSLSAAKAADAGSDAADAFRAIGVDPTKLGNLDKALVDIIFKLGKVEDGSRRNELANEFFGKSFDELIPLIRQGEEGFKKLQEEYAKLKIDPDKIQKFSEKSDELQKNINKLTSNSAVIFTPLIEGLANLTEALVKNQSTFKSWYDAAVEYTSRGFEGIAALNSVTPTSLARGLVNAALPETGKQTFSGKVGGVVTNQDYSNEGRGKPFIPLAKAVKSALGSGAEKKDPFIDYSQSLQRLNAELKFSVENFDRFKGDTQASKVAAVEFDLAFGKMSDASRKAEGLSALSAKQKELALSTAQSTQAFQEQVDKLKALSAFDDYLNNLGAEISLLNASADEREIALKGLDLEKDKIAAGTKEYDERIERLKALLEVRKQLNEANQLASFVREGQQGLDARQAEIDAIGKTTLEVMKLTEARRIDLQVQNEIFDATGKQKVSDEQRAALESAGASLKANTSALIEQQYNKSRSPETGANNFFNKYIEDSQDAAKAVEDAFSKSFSALEDSLVGFATTGKLTFSSFVNSISADLARIAVKEGITAPLAKFMQKSFGGGGGDSGGSIFSYFGSAIGSLFGGGKAIGGPLASGKNYLVGENGPEMLSTLGNGRIYTANRTREMNAGSVVNINITNTGGSDSASSSQLAQKVGASVQRALRRNS